MTKRLACGVVALLLLALIHPPVLSDDPPEDDPCAQDKWLTWSPNDCQGNAISLTSYQDKTVFVIVFTPSNEDSCKLVSKAAEYCRDHAASADKVLAFCSDNKGADGIKLHLRQEEWARRVKAWNDAQALAKAAAEANEQTYEAPAMPDFSKQIEDDQKTAEGLAAMTSHHLPFKTCARDDAMWTWLSAKMNAPKGAPRILKVDSEGAVQAQWTELADNPNPLGENN